MQVLLRWLRLGEVGGSSLISNPANLHMEGAPCLLSERFLLETRRANNLQTFIRIMRCSYFHYGPFHPRSMACTMLLSPCAWHASVRSSPLPIPLPTGAVRTLAVPLQVFILSLFGLRNAFDNHQLYNHWTTVHVQIRQAPPSSNRRPRQAKRCHFASKAPQDAATATTAPRDSGLHWTSAFPRFHAGQKIRRGPNRGHSSLSRLFPHPRGASG